MANVGVATKSDVLPQVRRRRAIAWLAACGKRPAGGAVAMAGLAALVLALSANAALSASCKPSHPRPPIVLKDMGACAFDPQTLSFAGTPREQARCLMRGMDATRNLGPKPDHLPPALASRIGQTGGLPTREALSGLLSRQNLEWDFAAYLWQPLSRADDDDPGAPMARYFVIHDTSGPSFGRRAFPADIDTSTKINNLASFKCRDGWGKAHVVVNRFGGMLLDHELEIPWRETKFERAVNFAGALKGLFIHVEMIQPRRSAVGPDRQRRNDAQSPDPSFTRAQYDRLALLYVIASVRAGQWLVPAFHAAIDAHIRNGHDDPLNFDIASFAASLDAVVDRLHGAPTPLIAQAESPSEAAAAAARPAAAAATTASTTGAIVKPDAAAPRLAAIEPHGGPEPGAKRRHAAAREAESKGGRSKHDRTVAGRRHCQASLAHGHGRRGCGTHVAGNRVAKNHGVAKNRGRRRHARAVRSVDRSVPSQSRSAWDNGGNLHARHARNAAGHDRT